MDLAHLVGRWEPGHLAVMADVSFCVLRRLLSMWFFGCEVAGGNWLISFGCGRQLVVLEPHFGVLEAEE